MKNTKKIKLILFALCFGAFFILFGSTSKVNANITLQVKNTNILNVRAEENSDSNTEILGVLYKGDTINVDYVNKETGWARLSSPSFVRESANSKKYIGLSKTGYCKLSYLKMPSKNILYKTKNKIDVYDSFDNSPKKISHIKSRQLVKVVATNDTWAKLSNGGYCLKENLNKYSGSVRYVYNTPLLNVRSSPYVLDTNKKGKLTPAEKVSVVETVTTKDTNGNEYKWAKLKNGNYCCLDYLTKSQLDAVVYSEMLADAQTVEYYKNNNNYTDNSSQIKLESTPHFTTSTVNVYEKSSTDSKVQYVLEPFTKIDVVDWKEGWFEIYGGYYIQSKDVALYISKIDVYLANLSTTKGKIVLTCSNGQQLVYHCVGGNQGYPTPLRTSLAESPHIFSKGYVEIEDSLKEKIFNFTRDDCTIILSKETL